MVGYLCRTRSVRRIGPGKWAILFALLVSTGAFPNEVGAQAPGQQYDSLTIAPQYLYPELTGNETFQEKRDNATLKKDATKIITDGKSNAQSVLNGSSSRTAAFDAYFNEFVFPSMAQATDATTSTVGLLRQDFIKTYLSPSYRPGGNRAYLIETLTVPMCRQLATGNYHPSVRMNAIYLAGLLNDREGERDVFPAPNKAAFALLMETLRNPASPEYLVASSASALTRIAEVEGSAPSGLDVASLRGYVNSVLAGQAAGQGNWQPDTDYWLRKRSVQILGFLHDSSALGELNRIASNPSLPMQMRIDATEAIGRIGFAGAGAGQAASETVMAVSTLAADVLSAESKGIRSTIEDRVAINLLWGNIYLIEPNAGLGEDGNPALPGARSGAGEAGRMEGAGAAGGATTGDDDPPAGQSGGGQGAGRGGTGTTGSGAPVVAVTAWRAFNLPNYHINQVRRRSKAYIYVCDTVLLNISKANLVGGNEKTVLDQTLTVLKNAMVDTDIGLRDLSGRSERRNAPTSVFGGSTEDDGASTTIKMMEMFDAHAAKVREFLPKPDPVEPQQPAATQGSPAVSAPTGVGT